MKIDFSKPRTESKTFQNKNLNFQKLGTSESLADRMGASWEIKIVQKRISHIAGLLPKLEKKELKEHEVKPVLDIEGKVFENLIPAMEESVGCYEITAQVMSDLVDKILPEILKMKLLPTDKKVKPKHHLKLRPVRKGVVPLEDMTRKLGVNESILRRGHVRKEIRVAMRHVYWIAFKLKGLENDLRTKLSDERYKQLIQTIQTSQRGVKRVKIEEIPEVKKLEKVFRREESIIMRFVEALDTITQEYDDIAFIEADIERIIRRLTELGVKAANPNMPLIPPADLSKFINMLEERTMLLQKWVHAARIDQGPFQEKLDEAKKIFNGARARFGGYCNILFAMADFTQRWCNLAFRDMEALWQRLDDDLKQLDQLRSMLSR